MPAGGNSGLEGGRRAPGPLLSPALGVELCAWVPGCGEVV